MAEEDQKVLKDAILRKFQALSQSCGPTTKEEIDEIRLTIKLMIHAFKNEADSVFAFKEYTKLIQTPVQMLVATGPIRLLTSILL